MLAVEHIEISYCTSNEHRLADSNGSRQGLVINFGDRMSVATIVSRARRAIRRGIGGPLSPVDHILMTDPMPPSSCSGIDPWIGFAGDFKYPTAADLKRSFDRANNGSTTLPNWVSKMEGMTGAKYRGLINTLVATTKDPRYLEIGSWRGSSACSAMIGNAAKITCIDDWSEFGGPREVFFENVGRCLTENIAFTCIEADYRKVDFASLGKFNIYLFDGPHSEDDHHRAVCSAYEALDDTFTLIVDDWNWSDVRRGTKRAIQDSNLHVVAIISVRTSADNSHGQPHAGDWHNGYLLAVCQKRR